MKHRYEIKRFTNIKAPDGTDATFFEVWDVIDDGSEKRLHRNHERAFKSEAEAQAWIDDQST